MSGTKTLLDPNVLSGNNLGIWLLKSNPMLGKIGCGLMTVGHQVEKNFFLLCLFS
jgi:hypothetical protein